MQIHQGVGKDNKIRPSDNKRALWEIKLQKSTGEKQRNLYVLIVTKFGTSTSTRIDLGMDMT